MSSRGRQGVEKRSEPRTGRASRTRRHERELPASPFEAARRKPPPRPRAHPDGDPHAIIRTVARNLEEAFATPAAAAAPAPAPAPAPLLRSAEVKELRAFDFVQAYGPCVGLTRMARWRRAEKFGLQPPQRVLQLLERIGEDSPEAQSLLAAYSL